jgi:hypothetical protein
MSKKDKHHRGISSYFGEMVFGPEAQSGYNDDLVMSFAIGMYVRDTALKYKTQGLDLTRAALSNMATVRPNNQGNYTMNGVPNPYQMNIGGQGEDIRWLL